MTRKRFKQNSKPSFFNIVTNGETPTLQLFGDIGLSKNGSWWDEDGGAGTFREFDEELKKLGNVATLRVEIHSYGGSVMVGQAIHDKLLEHPAHKTAYIYGVCASAATYPALACDEVKIPANAYFLIHNATSGCFGDRREMEKVASELEIIDQSLSEFYSSHTGKTAEEIREIMDKDTYMTGREAVELGLADEVIEPVKIQAQANLQNSGFFAYNLANMPDEAKAWFDMSASLSPRSQAIKTMSTQNHATPPTPTAAPAAPAAEPAATPAPINQAPTTIEPAVSAAPQQDLSTIITNAVTTAVKPLQEKIEALEAANRQGIALGNLGGAAPVGNVLNPENAEPTNEAELSKALGSAKSHAERSNILRKWDARNKK